MTKTDTSSLILDHDECIARINRIAWEIYEANIEYKNLLLVGIGGRGGDLAQMLKEKLESISPLNIVMLPASKMGEGEVELAEDSAKKIKGKAVVIVDDVLYSGRTIFSAAAKTVALSPASIQVAVLIDRGHRSLPVSPDFVGLRLATTLKQHVTVEVSGKGKKISAYLS